MSRELEVYLYNKSQNLNKIEKESYFLKRPANIKAIPVKSKFYWQTTSKIFSFSPHVKIQN